MGILNTINDFFWRLILPKERIAGIELKDAGIRIAQIVNAAGPAGGQAPQEFRKESILLEPGIIEGGIIKDKARLIAQLKALKEQFSPGKKEKIPVIALLPSSAVYAQIFSLPALDKENKREAIELNLQSISPVDFKSVYAGWEQVEEKDNKVDFLSAFASRDIVDSYADALMAAGFSPAAVEFPALAISRAIKEFGVGVEQGKPQVVIHISSDGIDFIILKNGSVYFNYFASWKLVKMDGGGPREISFEDFKDVIVRELRRISTFYASQWGGSIQSFILITQAFEEEISQVIEIQFHYKVTKLALRGFDGVPLSWVAMIGSAFRGTIDRSGDAFISLMAVGTEKEYWYSQVTAFVKLWRNVALSVFVSFIIIFIVTDSFFAHIAASVADQIQGTVSLPNGIEVEKLQKDAKVFNAFTEKAAYAMQRSKAWSPFLNTVDKLLGAISMDRISFSPDQGSVFLIGKASSEAAVIDFKNRLIGSGVQNVNLPLSKIVDNVDGTVSFSMTFSTQ